MTTITPQSMPNLRIKELEQLRLNSPMPLKYDEIPNFFPEYINLNNKMPSHTNFMDAYRDLLNQKIVINTSIGTEPFTEAHFRQAHRDLINRPVFTTSTGTGSGAVDVSMKDEYPEDAVSTTTRYTSCMPSTEEQEKNLGSLKEHISYTPAPKNIVKRTTLNTATKQKLEDIITKLVDQYGFDLPLEKAFFAGGCIRDLQNNIVPKDYDVYFETEEQVEVVRKFCAKNNKFVQTSLGNYNLILDLSHDLIVVQFITYIHGRPAEVIDMFDFTINQNYYTFDGERSCVSHATLEKKLVPNPSCIKPIHALTRVSKFTQRGYTIDGLSLIEMAERAVGQKIPEDIRENEMKFIISGD